MTDQYKTDNESIARNLDKAFRFTSDTAAPQNGYWREEVAVSNAVSSVALSVTEGGFDISTANATTVALSSGASFTGVAEDITKYPQVSFTVFADPSSAQGSAYFEFSPDGTNWDVSVPILVENPNLFIPYTLISVGKFFRVRYVNDGGTTALSFFGENVGTTTPPVAQTAFRLNTLLHKQPTKELTRTLAQQITAHQPVTLVRSVATGQAPTGEFTNAKTDGTAFVTEVALGANGTFTSDWVDTDGWAMIEVVVATSVAASGITIQFTDDVQGTQTVRATRTLTYSSVEAAAGQAVYRFPVELDGFRLIYNNAGAIQPSFFLQADLRVQDSLASAGVEVTITPTNSAIMARSILNAKNDAGTYDNILRSSSGGLRMSMLQHEVETPIKPLGTIHTSQADITTAVTQFCVTPLSSRKTISIKASATNSTYGVVGHDNAVTTATGYHLFPGDSVDIEASTAVNFFGRVGVGTIRYSWMEIAP